MCLIGAAVFYVGRVCAGTSGARTPAFFGAAMGSFTTSDRGRVPEGRGIASARSEIEGARTVSNLIMYISDRSRVFLPFPLKWARIGGPGFCR